MILDYSSANWYSYQRIIKAKLPERLPDLHEIDNQTKIDEMVDALERAMLDSQKATVPLKRASYGVYLPENIKQLITRRNNLRRQVKRNRFMHNQITPEVNRLNKDIKRRIADLINANFNHKLSEIEANDNHRDLWRTAKFLKNRRNIMPPLKVNDQTLMTPREKAAALATQFAKNHDNPLAESNVTFTRHVVNSVTRFSRNCTPESIAPILATEQEVKACVMRLKNSKAPGQDRVYNRLIKNLPAEG